MDELSIGEDMKRRVAALGCHGACSSIGRGSVPAEAVGLDGASVGSECEEATLIPTTVGPKRLLHPFAL